MPQQWIVFLILALTLLLFILDRWRYDVIALFALLLSVLTGIVPAENAFSGFGHPAVITVAAILVVSRGLLNSGLVDLLSRSLSRVGDRPASQVGALCVLIAFFSAFMNNIGALALFMPAAICMARKSRNAPSLLLMPLAFASLLGGLVTLIGTPPNIIISAFRQQNTDASAFGMFAFAPVGLGIALAGVIFISLIGWRLMPRRRGQASPEERFDIQDYITEVAVGEESAIAGKRLHELESGTDIDITVVGLSRDGHWSAVPYSYTVLRPGDILAVKADSADVQELLDTTGLLLPENGDFPPVEGKPLRSDDTSIVEAVIMPHSRLEGKTPGALSLHQRYGINLLALARQGGNIRNRLRQTRLRTGDVLLLQGHRETLDSILPVLGCLPLAERNVQLGRPNRALFAVVLFTSALLLTVAGILPVQVAFTAAALAMVATGLLPVKSAYDSIDWPVIVLLGAMIPVGTALETSGGAEAIAGLLLSLAGPHGPILVLTVLLAISMALSNVVNNAAAAVLMAPIGLSLAGSLSVSADPFLMAVAVGSSCAFLTPIGHQSNTIVMGPGGYKFGDYWRMGLPLQLLILAIAIPLILHFWPM